MSSDTVRVYPTHLRSAGDLHVAVGTEEIVITDEGTEIPADLAEQLIRFRDASRKPPVEPEE